MYISSYHESGRVSTLPIFNQYYPNYVWVASKNVQTQQYRHVMSM